MKEAHLAALQEQGWQSLGQLHYLQADLSTLTCQSLAMISLIGYDID